MNLKFVRFPCHFKSNIFDFSKSNYDKFIWHSSWLLAFSPHDTHSLFYNINWLILTAFKFIGSCGHQYNIFVYFFIATHGSNHSLYFLSRDYIQHIRTTQLKQKKKLVVCRNNTKIEHKKKRIFPNIHVRSNGTIDV